MTYIKDTTHLGICKYFLRIFPIFPYARMVAKGEQMWYHWGMDKEKKKQKEEKKAQKKALQAEKRRARVEKHVVVCPHCGKNVLDHMSECPYCKGALVPSGYKPVDPEKFRKIKLACSIAGIAVAIAVVVVIFVVLQ